MKRLLFCLLIMSMIAMPVYAAEDNFGISIDCYNSCVDNEVDTAEGITLVLTIKNNLDYWISIGEDKEYGGVDFWVNAEHARLPSNFGSDLHQELLGRVFVIEPKDEYTKLIPFKTYNDLDKDDRLGRWAVTPKLSIDNVRFYEDASLSKQVYPQETGLTNIRSIHGNVLEFKAIKPEITITTTNAEPPGREWDVHGWLSKYAGELQLVSLVVAILGILVVRHAKKPKIKAKPGQRPPYLNKLFLNVKERKERSDVLKTIYTKRKTGTDLEELKKETALPVKELMFIYKYWNGRGYVEGIPLVGYAITDIKMTSAGIDFIERNLYEKIRELLFFVLRCF